MPDLNLFGEKPIKPRKTTKPKGYAARPGSGPKGEKCKTCKHMYRRTTGAGHAYFKCLKMREHWGHTRTTDILARAPACYFWEKK